MLLRALSIFFCLFVFNSNIKKRFCTLYFLTLSPLVLIVVSF